MTKEKLQKICDKIQSGWGDSKNYYTSNRMYNGKWYYNYVVIEGVEYEVNVSLKIIVEDVEL